jgi:flap endonuclease-1
MGIKNLIKVLNDNAPNSISNISVGSLKGKKIAIDTSIVLYQYVTAIRSSGDDLKGPDNKSTSHIFGILIKTLNYLKMGLIPVHIFDGKPPQLKMKILKDRSKIKNDAISKLIQIEDKKVKDSHDEIKLDDETIQILENEKIKLLKQSVSISHKEMIQACEIVQLLGVPCIFAPEEADSQCAYLSRNLLVDYVASEDMDLLTFGTNKLIRNFMKKNMFVIELNKILSSGKISMDEFIDICILLGCDYTDTIEGIGQKKAWELIKQYGSIDELITKEKKITESKYKLPNNFRYEEAREYFTNPRHKTMEIDDLKLKIPQFDKLKKLLIETYGFNEENIEDMIGFLRKKYNIFDKDYQNKIQDLNDPFIDDEQNIIKTKTKAKPKAKPKAKS